MRAAVPPAIAVLVIVAGCGSSERCAERLVGDKVCGKELVAFCEQRYDPAINKDTCEPVLREAGEDPEQIARRNARAEQEHLQESIRNSERAERERIRRETEKNRRFAGIDQPAVDDGIRFTVHRPTTTRTITSEFESVTAKSGRTFLVFRVDISNQGRAPTDIICTAAAGSSAFMLLDDAGRQFQPNTNAMLSSSSNAEACGNDLQPGDTASSDVVFQVKPSIAATDIIVWNPAKPGPEDGGTHLDVRLP